MGQALGRDSATEDRRTAETQGLKVGKKPKRGTLRSSMAIQSGTDLVAIVNLDFNVQ